MKRIVLALFVAMAFSQVYAQEECCQTTRENNFCWQGGELDVKATKEYYALWDDAVKNKKYQEALDAQKVILKNIPCFHVSLYQEAETIYKNLVSQKKKAGDKEGAKALGLELLDIMDQRIKYFGDEAMVMNRKGFYLLPYKMGTKKYDEIEAEYAKIIELNGDGTYDQNHSNYWYIYQIQKQYFNKYSNDEYLAMFDKYTKMADEKIAANKSVKTWTALKTKMGKDIETLLDPKCTFKGKIEIDEKLITDRWVPLIGKDEAKTKQVYKFFWTNKAYDNEHLMSAIMSMYGKEPTIGLAKQITFLHIKNGRQAERVEWMNKQIELYPQDSVDARTDLKMQLAQMKVNDKEYSEARKLALEALEYDAEKNKKAVYSFIAGLYMRTAGCAAGRKDVVQKQAVYFMAYDTYAKAGDSKGMANARAHFPQKSDMFTLGYKEGDAISIGCWIGGSSTIRSR